MQGFVGFVILGATFLVNILTRNGNVPADGDSAAPTFRVYGPGGLMNNGSGSASFTDHGTITGATNASPIVITSASHGLTVGTRVTISGVLGNTGANGTFVVSAADTNTFTLSSSTGTGAYTSGGIWHATGLYQASINVTANNGYVAGQTYCLVWNATVSSTAQGDSLTFTVT